ncbi:hypothetical protein SUDANB91_04844 [Streptomyces sp. SudanB91_2054]|jgi:type I restriction enzyme S subunit
MELGQFSEQARMDALPHGWQYYTIDQTLTLTNGAAFRPSEWKTHGTPIIRIQNLNNDSSPYNYYDGPIGEKHRIRAGDILFAWSGTTGTSFGARVWTGPNAVLNQHIFKVTPDKTKLTPYYSFLVLQNVQKEIERQAHGFKSSFVHVKKSDLVKVCLPIPPIPEQRSIGKALSEVDQLIANLGRLMKKKQAIKQGVMQQLLTGETRLPGFETEWRRRSISDLLQPRSERNTSGNDLTVLTCTKNLGFVRSLDYFKNQVFSRNLSGYRVIYRGDIGYPANHVEEGSIGVQEIEDRALVSPIYVVMEPKPDVDSYFLQRMLKLDTYRQKFSQATNASVDRRGSLRWPEFSRIEVSVPDIEEQRCISRVLRDTELEISKLEQRIRVARDLKQGMAQELLSGRTRLPVMEATL